MRKVGELPSRKSTDADRDFQYKTIGWVERGFAPPSLFSNKQLTITKEATQPYPHHKAEEAASVPDKADLKARIKRIKAWLKAFDRAGKPRPWRDTTDELKAVYFERALTARRGRSPYAFTLRIDQNLIANEKSPTDFMRRRFHYHLQQAVGRSVDLWAAVESEGEIYFHGHVDIGKSEKAAVIAALRDVGGNWRPGRGQARQLDVKPGFNVDHWAGYATKNLAEARAELSRRREALGVISKREPAVLIVSAPLRTAAEALYETHRARLAQPNRAAAR